MGVVFSRALRFDVASFRFAIFLIIPCWGAASSTGEMSLSIAIMAFPLYISPRNLHAQYSAITNVSDVFGWFFGSVGSTLCEFVLYLSRPSHV